MASFYSSFSTSVSSFSCSYSPPPSPPPAFGASATIPTTPKPLRKELTAPSAITQTPPPAFGASATIPITPKPLRKELSAPSAIPQTPPKTTTPTNAPPAPKKQSQTQSPNDILREAMNIFHPMAYGTPYPGYDEDFDENEPLDDEELSEDELSEEEIEDIIERSREGWRNRHSLE